MQLAGALARICRSDEPGAAFRATAEELAREIPLACALRVEPQGPAVVDAWPCRQPVSAELLEAAAHAPRAEVFPLGGHFPQDAERFPGSEMLLLPIPADEEPTTALLICGAGAFGEDMEDWEELARSLARHEATLRRLVEAERERDTLRRRVAEAEALQTLGLAANRTLDPAEVLQLVARCARAMLGAHYATIATLEDGAVARAASVGVRDPEEDGEAPLAREIVERGTPVVLGDPPARLRPEDFPFHARQGMRAGVGIPLSLFGECFGALVVGYRRAHRVGKGEVRLAVALAQHASVAIGNARLHRRVEEHSRELEAAYARLRDLTRAKERFFTGISHDLRTPITGVRGYADLLLHGLGGELPPRAVRFVENTRRAADAMLALVNEIMDFARLDAGRVEISPTPCDLGAVLEDALAAVRPQAADRRLRLRGPERAALPPVVTDGARVRQILVNLLANAVKFTPEGEVAVEVRAGDAGETAWIEIRVRDTGRGIPAEHLERVFEEFEQVPGSEGTGLGLPISRRLARLLGGDLRAESRVGEGSTFVLRLPRRPSPPPARP
jgi:signal transduction histidine kinase